MDNFDEYDEIGYAMLKERLRFIKEVIEEYGEENFYLSFSGGMDSTVCSKLVDLAVPGNTIPRVFANTGIEYLLIVKFVMELASKDSRIVIIKPSRNIKETLEKEGYPFKSKGHSEKVYTYQCHGTLENRPGLQHYLHTSEDGVNWSHSNSCPEILKYQFTNNFNLKISDKCCLRLKEEPLRKWARKNNKPYAILGLMREEGGRRKDAVCLACKKGALVNFQPMVKLTKFWEKWFIDRYDIDICKIYKPPYNFKRTGCKGCPFNPNLQEALDTLEKFFPDEKKQCEYIWKPVYDEYRRIGYRLKGGD